LPPEPKRGQDGNVITPLLILHDASTEACGPTSENFRKKSTVPYGKNTQKSTLYGLTSNSNLYNLPPLFGGSPVNTIQTLGERLETEPEGTAHRLSYCFALLKNKNKVFKSI
jgi:hypothetical protein